MSDETDVTGCPVPADWSPAQLFWARVYAEDVFAWVDYDSREELVRSLAERYGVPAVRFRRWGFLGDRELVLPSPQDANRIAIATGMPLTELRGFYSQAEVSIPPKLRLVK